MSRGFAGVSDPRHHALVLQAIEERVKEGVPRAQAAADVLNQEYQWRAEEAAAAHYTPVVDFVNEVIDSAYLAARRWVRRPVRRSSPEA